jgi:hypothetical protein
MLFKFSLHCKVGSPDQSKRRVLFIPVNLSAAHQGCVHARWPRGRRSRDVEGEPVVGDRMDISIG